MYLAINISQCYFVKDAISCKRIPCYNHDNYPTQGFSKYEANNVSHVNKILPQEVCKQY